MCGPGRHGRIAARQLVLALGARLNSLQSPRDGKIDGLVIAEFEMQEGHVLHTAPITSIQGMGSKQLGSASCRERVCRVLSNTVFAASLKEKKIICQQTTYNKN